MDPLGLQPGGFDDFPVTGKMTDEELGPPLPTLVDISQTIPSDRIGVFDYANYVIGPDRVTAVFGIGLCKCPEGTKPVKDSTKFTDVTPSQAVRYQGPEKSTFTVRFYQDADRQEYGGGAAYVARRFYATCKCRTECGDEIEVPFEGVTRDSQSFRANIARL